MNRPIVVIGSSNVDMIVKLKNIPRMGETVIGGRFSTACGGKGANQAVAAARAGGDVKFMGRLGEDMFGDKSLSSLRAAGVRVDLVKRLSDVSSGVAFIFVDERGENSIGVASGANALLSPGDIDAAEAALSGAALVLLQLEVPLDAVCRAAAIAFRSGVPVLLNPAPARVLPPDLLRTVSIITPNELEAETLTGIRVTDEESAHQAALSLLRSGVGTAIITMGKRGSYVVAAQGCRAIPAFAVDAVDTTAAGDVFNGALAVALTEGNDIMQAVTFATGASALSVTKLGAQESIPGRREIDDFLAEHLHAALD